MVMDKAHYAVAFTRINPPAQPGGKWHSERLERFACGIYAGGGQVPAWFSRVDYPHAERNGETDRALVTCGNCKQTKEYKAA